MKMSRTQTISTPGFLFALLIGLRLTVQAEPDSQLEKNPKSLEFSGVLKLVCPDGETRLVQESGVEVIIRGGSFGKEMDGKPIKLNGVQETCTNDFPEKIWDGLREEGVKLPPYYKEIEVLRLIKTKPAEIKFEDQIKAGEKITLSGKLKSLPWGRLTLITDEGLEVIIKNDLPNGIEKGRVEIEGVPKIRKEGLSPRWYQMITSQSWQITWDDGRYFLENPRLVKQIKN